MIVAIFFLFSFCVLRNLSHLTKKGITIINL
jgi:hypothetical protein